LVVDEATFKRIANRSHDGMRPVFDAAFRVDGSHPDGPWTPYLVDREHLAKRIGLGQPRRTTLEDMIGELAPAAHDPRDVGSLGEAEVLRQLAENPLLNLFRPFPDLETVELVVRNTVSHQIVGLQVKTVGVDPDHPEATVSIREPSFRPSKKTWLIVVAWLRQESHFHPECLLIPTIAVPTMADAEENHLRFKYRPGSQASGRLGPYRLSRAGLANAIEQLIS
jgi:hypothetical protein